MHYAKILRVLKNPRPYYKEALRRVSVKLNPPKHPPRKNAESWAWCQEKAVDTKTALYKIAGFQNFRLLDDEFPEETRLARAAVQNCPVPMGGLGNGELLYYLAEYLEATKVIETGVAYGWSSFALLLSLKNRANSLLISTDLPHVTKKGNEIFKKGDEIPMEYIGCAVPEHLKSAWKIIMRPDKDALPEALKILPEIDLAHYDSDKSYEGRMRTYPILWKALRRGGILISDDVGDNFGFRDFSLSLGKEPIVARYAPSKSIKFLTTPKYCGVLIKN